MGGRTDGGKQAALSPSTRRDIRHAITELDTIDKTVKAALENGRWWNVAFEGLPAERWRAAEDALAEDAPDLYHAVASVYTAADQLNKAAKTAANAQGPGRPYDARVREDLQELRSLTGEATDALHDYLSEDQP